MASEFYAPGLMDLSGYRLELVEDSEVWDKFVFNSIQGTVFNSASFLEALNQPVKKWGCYKGSELKGAVCGIESGVSEFSRPKLLIYNSILLPKADAQQAKANQFAEEFRTISAMVKGLTDHYESISLQTHYSLQDLRPFLWHNYGTDLAKFILTPKFTATIKKPESYIDGEALQENPLYLQCSKSRRQEIRYAISKEVIVESRLDIELFEKLYRYTFERQNLSVDEDQLKAIKNICEVLDERQELTMYIAADKDGEVGSIAIFAYFGDTAYYLYGANSAVAKTSHTGSYVIYYACTDLFKKGINEVDLEGVNSPARGHFKLSFGAELKQYYTVDL